jgi:hypothetical protein
VDQSKGAEPKPSDAIRCVARDRKTGETEQDEGKPIEEQYEVCLFRNEVCHLRCERLIRMLATPWHAARYMLGGGIGTICVKSQLFPSQHVAPTSAGGH